MRRELNDLKSTVANLAAIVQGTNGRLESTNAKLESTNAKLESTNAKLDRVVVAVAQLVGKVGEVDGKISGMESRMVTRDEFNSRMDGFAGLLLDSRQRWATHADTLAQHDKRLTKLEPPTA